MSSPGSTPLLGSSATPSAERPSTQPVLEGVCHVLLAVHVGQEIDLARAEARLDSPASRARLRHKRGAAPDGAVHSPLRVEVATGGARVGAWSSAVDVGASLHDVGAVCVSWRFPFHSTLEELAELSEGLYGNEELTRGTRSIATDLLATLGDAVRRPGLAEEVEDYAVFQVRTAPRLAPVAGPDLRRLAGVLRGEREELSAQEVDDALACPISYSPGEACYVDWHAAVLVGEEMDDELLVLELATVSLLELRVLDQELRSGVEAAYAALARSRSGLGILSAQGAQLERIARMEADGAILREGLDNPLELLGDDYLARLHERAAQRFHFADWDRSIERKLRVLGSLYEKLSEHAARRRGEALEWIIILLIAADILVYLGGSG